MSINITPEPAMRQDIETAVGILIEYLNADSSTDLVVRLSGTITDDQVKGIEQGLLLVTRRQVKLVHHYYDQPEDGEVEGGYTVLGTVELIS